ncbi:hypothetical protein F2P56_032524, partial [Juglans regia]
MGVRIVVRDNNGDVLDSLCAPRNYVTSPILAECNALWKAMEMCIELGFREVIFEGDAKAVLIEAVKSEDDDDDSWRGQIIEDIKQIIRTRAHWSVAFIHREGKEVAHQLAKIALQNEGELYWMENGPRNIYHLIVK